MHFSIPDTEEFTEDNGSTYTSFNIHVNGMFHCSVRYRQLHNLHEQFKKQFSDISLPPFPPKKFLPLTSNQLEERRIMLEKYIQSVGQKPELLHTELFNGFLLSAQQETRCEERTEVPLDVFLMNGHKTSLKVMTNERTDQVLEKMCKYLNLPEEYIFYFSLFLIQREKDGDITIIRKLQDFESPYISQKAIKGVHRLVLRKSYWDPSYDLQIMWDKAALNLLYLQTVADIERGWVLASKEKRQQLASLQARGAKKEYLEIARTLKYYGFLQFRPCICNYPQPNTQVIVSIGNRELNLRIKSSESDEMREGCFKVTRMRCWRITTQVNNDETKTETNSSPATRWELSFEYLIAEDKLQWITISSDQAVLMSVCLQSVVDELLLKKAGVKPAENSDRAKKGSYSYMKRDGSSHKINEQPISSANGVCHLNNESLNEETKPSHNKTESSSSMRRLSEKLTNVTLKSSSKQTENDAFEGIGDDDL